jgi:CheY-like chemotaxis protein
VRLGRIRQTPVVYIADESFEEKAMTCARQKRVLAVENDVHFRHSLQVLLEANGYRVFGAGTADEGMLIATRKRVHVAVLDIRLKNDPDRDDMSGLVLARELDPLIIKIMMSAYPNVEVLRSTFGDVSAFTFVDKEDPPGKLLEELAKAFDEKVKINFDLSIGWQGISLEEVARDIEIDDRPPLEALEAEVDELLCKLFSQADEIQVSRLIPVDRIPSASQSGAVLLKVQPHFERTGWGTHMVVKLAARDKIEVEAVNYEQYVDGFIAGFRHTKIHHRVETHLLGGIIYTLVGTPIEECVDLGNFYAEHSASETVRVLEGLFKEICCHWYANRDPRRTHDMMQLYARPLKLKMDRLDTALAEAGLSDWAGGRRVRHKIAGLKGRFFNPIEWLGRTPNLPAQTSLCSTHGDMHSRNLLVDPDHHAWLIDFYRTGPGHLFRDLIELESDVKFTLLDVTDLPSLLRFESALLSADHFNDAPTIPSFEEPRLTKAFRVVQGIRHIAGQLADPGADMLDYYQGLLLQTLSVIRLRHVTPEKKRHVYLAAALLVEQLERW